MNKAISAIVISIIVISGILVYLNLHSGKLSLAKVNTYDVTPKTSEQLRSWRPEIQKIGDKFYYAFNKEKGICPQDCDFQ